MRRHFVVTYDIADDKRRDEAFRTLLGFGNHAQYSVFICELNDREVVKLRSRLRQTINNDEDQVMLMDFGPASRPFEESLEVLGKSYRPSTRVIVV